MSHNTTFLIGNFGNASIAVAQWALDKGISINYVSVDTGFARLGWERHCTQVKKYFLSSGIKVTSLESKSDFKTLVLERGSFPSKKFQWCSGLLKGLAINDYLAQVDPLCEATIWLSRAAFMSRLYHNSTPPELAEHYDDRLVEFPLWDASEHSYLEYIKKTGLDLKCNQKSHECSPCIHTHEQEIQAIPSEDIKRLKDLECSANAYMFNKPINAFLEPKQMSGVSNSLESFDMGCGSIWGCGE